MNLSYLVDSLETLPEEVRVAVYIEAVGGHIEVVEMELDLGRTWALPVAVLDEDGHLQYYFRYHSH